MEKEHIPLEKETANNRQLLSLFEVEEETEEHRLEVFHKADEGDELPFDVPRD